MTGRVPRARMFAGPNGSGKSTINGVIGRALLGVYVNADEIEREVRATDALDLRAYGVQTTAAEVLAFFGASRLLASADLLDEAAALRFGDGRVSFAESRVNSYLAAAAADFIRHKLVDARADFTFEIVMSSRDKVQFLAEARARGYRTYLYYVATDDPEINVARVRHRVRTGGHPVPEDKIVSRYHRSLDLLADAVRHADRAYFFDNSGTGRVWVAEAEAGRLALKTDRLPLWFTRAVWDKLAGAGARRTEGGG